VTKAPLKLSSILSCVVVILLSFQAQPAAAGQNAHPGRDRNPERRGIRLLKDEDIRVLSTPRKKPKTFPLDERKSIFVTDVAILQLFKFDELMERLASESGPKKVGKEQLFQQWWDTANPKTTFNVTFGGPNCTVGGQLNDFPYTCPRNEGQQAIEFPFGPSTDATYTAIALSNRFDLTTPPSKGGGDCGEYRIVFERNSGATAPTNRNLIIFEAVLPNPHPEPNSLKGCRTIQDFWEDLSAPGLSVAKRGKMLHDFYYEGLPKDRIPPVVMAKHYGSAAPNADGQIRTNQFMSGSNPQTWMLRQFHIVQNAQGMRIIPVTVATNPPASLFNEKITQPSGTSFRNDFLNQIAALTPDQANCNATNLIDCISMETAGQYDDGESEEGAVPPSPAMDYGAAFANSPQFRAAILTKLSGSSLTPENIVARAQTQSCAGCHHISVNASLGGGLTWPTTILPVPPLNPALAFTHEQLANPETGPDGPRYQISPALQNVFLPFRKHVIETFLQ
jgi:hypothetical protein